MQTGGASGGPDSHDIVGIRHGAFTIGAELFDNAHFAISTAEAGAMDPQQRLLLELGYSSLHASAQRRATLMGGDSGVFLGIERPDWAIAQPPSARGSVYAVTGDNISAAAGRLSFVLGLQGPCSSTDTACSSALAAVDFSRLHLITAHASSALAASVRGAEHAPNGPRPPKHHAAPP